MPGEQKKCAASEAMLAKTQELSLVCETCRKKFGSVQALKSHKASIKHHPLCNIRCPLSTKCRNKFTSPSGLLFHLESGACPSGMTRHKLNGIVYQYDTDRDITFEKHAPGAMAAAKGIDGLVSSISSLSMVSDGTNGMGTPCSWEARSEAAISESYEIIRRDNSKGSTPCEIVSRTRASSVSSGIFLTPTSSEWDFITDSGRLTDANTSAGPSSIAALTVNTNPNDQWPCAQCSKKFKERNHLLDHLNSPIHALKISHCPTAVVGPHRKKERDSLFKTLSGLAQHIEAGACAGGRATLDNIVSMNQKQIKSATGQEVKLLRKKN